MYLTSATPEPLLMSSHILFYRLIHTGFLVLILPLTMLAMPIEAKACSVETDCIAPTVEPGRVYRVYRPDPDRVSQRPMGAIIHAHGYRGTAASVVGNRHLQRMADRLGLVLIGLKSAGDDWALPNSPSHPNADPEGEMAYVDAVVADASARFDLDQRRLMASGFSAGGMMVWTMACHRGHLFAGFAPIAGTFWRPVPNSCPSQPANVIHIHGDADPVVPLGGRPIAHTHQGDVMKALTMYQRHGSYGPATIVVGDDLRCEERVNEARQILDFCQFKGGHAMRADHLVHAWRRLEAIGAFSATSKLTPQRR